MRSSGIVLWLFPALLLAACGGKERVTLSAHLVRTDLSVEDRTLGTFLTGEVEINLRLGPNAPEATTARFESFSLVRASNHLELVSPLTFVDLPAEVLLDPGDEQTVLLTLDDQDPIAADSRDEICQEPVLVLGSLTDTLSDGRPTPLNGTEVDAQGCI